MKKTQRHVVQWTLVLLVASLAGCASNEPKPIQTTDHFSTQIGDNGETQFAFGLSWFNLPEEDTDRGERGGRRGSRDGSRGGSRDAGLGGQSNRPLGSNLNPQPNNETKLALEDKAVLHLKQTIDKRDLCPNGYTIDDIIWETRRIRLMGACK
ncbi:hypothetical protein FX988_00109 [Paraglaciecola mesophila]|uniref:Lipoprotein n=1 Tax=Paraglaciecola mesophila TaxID=197222 RepID=A0A857JG03_9ALTE|nr:hypothetical protein [Paraglaciecola mesophila]QHJ09901.1 hypothetical protein FX988_00109 [Paraglaciecola mesophila]